MTSVHIEIIRLTSLIIKNASIPLVLWFGNFTMILNSIDVFSLPCPGVEGLAHPEVNKTVDDI